jgi:predicted flavoprotein YhiN
MGNDADLRSRNCKPSPFPVHFNIKDPRIKLPRRGTCNGKSKDKLESTGPLLITHWGMSGPAVLKLSAWGARILHDKIISLPYLSIMIETDEAEKYWR